VHAVHASPEYNEATVPNVKAPDGGLTLKQSASALYNQKAGVKTMKLTRINKSAATEVELPNGTTVLFSYSTPVACHIPGQGYYRTTKTWSRTTSKHISQFIRRNGASGDGWPIEQSELDAMVA
jgi:hypothetical protein